MRQQFSFIIPTFNGASKLLKSLPFVFQNAKDYQGEVILVVDGSTDQTIEYLSTFKDKPIKIISINNQGRAKARNIGIQATISEYIFLLDDDMRIKNNCLKVHQEHHLNYPGSILIGKVNLETPNVKYDFYNYLSHLYQKWDKGFNSKKIISFDNFKFTSCHLSMSKMTFNKIGGFDSRLNDAEDYDLGMRALEMKIPIYFDPEAISWHNDNSNCQQYIKRQIEYKKSHQRLKELGISYKKDVFEVISPPKIFFKLLILSLLKKNIWVSIIDGNYLKNYPRKFRYKFYSTVIYAHTLKGMGMI